MPGLISSSVQRHVPPMIDEVSYSNRKALWSMAVMLQYGTEW